MKSKFNENIFKKPNEEVSYFLGLLWGDGYMWKKGRQAIISIEMLCSDLNPLSKKLKNICNWNTLKTKKKLSKNIFLRITSNDVDFYNFLSNYGFLNKADSHDKILKFLGDKNVRYFFRGLFDADGCFSKTASGTYVIYTSEYEQNWSSLRKFCKRLKIPYRVMKRKTKRKNGKTYRFSQFSVVGGYDNSIRFLDKIYFGASKSKIYLKRKYKNYIREKELC